MDDTKPAYASTEVWGAAIALIGALTPLALNAAGIRNAADQQATVNAGMQLVAGFGAAIALYGRLTATKRIG